MADNSAFWFHRFQDIQPSERLMQLFQTDRWQLPPLYVLPPDIPNFIGRRIELDRAIATLRPGISTSTRPLVVLSGPSGIGKSALAVHIAHAAKRFFPDLLLCIDLKGTEPHPLDPEAVIVSLLQEWGIEPAVLPSSLTDRVQLLNSLMAGKRTLMVLDNAANAAQIQPLILSNLTCAVIVTSRNPLPELQGATAIALEPLLKTDALQWLLDTDKRPERSTSSDATLALAEFSNHIPLVLRLMEGTLRSCPDLGAEMYAMQLKQSSLPAIATCFAIAYRALPDDSAHLLRLLGLLTDMPASLITISALLDSDLQTAQQMLKPLIEAQLVESVGDRVRVHELIRPLIRHQLAADESTLTRKTVRLRLAEVYVNTLAVMAQSLNPSTRQQVMQYISIGEKRSLDVMEQKLLLVALRWYEAEKLNLQALLDWAHHTETWDVMFSFVEHLTSFFQYRADWTLWHDTHQQALQVAQQLGDRARAAQLLNSLGNAAALQRQWSQACDYYGASLKTLDDSAAPHWRAYTLANLGIAQAAQNNGAIALNLWESALNHLPPESADHQTMLNWMELTHETLYEQVTHSGSTLRTKRLIDTLSGMIKRLILE